MARKKRKAARPPPNLNRPAATSPARGGQKGFAPFPPPAGAGPIWPHFWTLLAAGFALRLLGAFSSDWFYRADELLQYLEQAHRLVFGAGFTPWEIRIGARNLLIAMPAAGIMTACKSAGAGPDCYIPAVVFFFAAASLAIPASLYLIARRLYNEAAGRVALIVGCLWYEFVVFAPRLMPEQNAAILIFAGLACVPAGAPGSGKPGLRLFLAGFCVALGGLLRLPYIPVAGLLGLLILWRFPPRWAGFTLGGAACGLAAAGAADWIVWGKFFHSIFAYLEASGLEGGPRALHGDSPWHIAAWRLTVCSFGLWPLVFALAAADWRRHWLALGIVSVLLVVHSLASTHSYSHVFLAVPALALALGGLAGHPPTFLRKALRGGKKTLAAAALAALSLAGASHSLPGLRENFWTAVGQPRFFFHEFPWLQAARFLSRVPPEKMRAAVWNAQDPLWTGGYYYFHHPVPQWFEGMSVHRPALEGRALGEVASHYVALSPDGARRAVAAGFQEAANFGSAVVYENPEWENVPAQWEAPFPLGLGIADDEALDSALEAAGKTPPPAAFLPPRE